ncbi:MAG: hypothetical protein N4A38_03895, partial [Candidatus Gracilibacteria bacterium]|nr:hypothetical protein [Candidatus Gracilibacteria bacterium]
LEASRKMLNSATNTAILADIFGDKIQGQVDEIANTEFAMRIYEEQIINGNDFLIDEVEDGLYKTSGELQYNLIRVKERFAEIREVMENEVMPIVSKISEYIIGGKIEEYANLIDKVKKSSEYDELTKLIISKYKK